MDDVSHALFGWAAAEAGPARRWGRPATAALVLSSLLPDADGIVALGGTSTYLVHHRGFTHALIGLIPTAAAAALAVWLCSGRRNFRVLFALSLFGIALHVLCDTVNAWGVMPLYPFSMRRWQLDWVFIIDGMFTGILLAAVVAARWKRSDLPARAGLGALAAYVALCGLCHALALRRVDALARDRGWTVVERAAMPMPPAVTQWSGLVATPQGTQQVWFGLLGGESHRQQEGLTPEIRRRLEASADGRAFLWFARFPVVLRDNGRVVLRDARFALPPGWPDRQPFAMELSAEGEPRWISDSR